MIAGVVLALALAFLPGRVAPPPAEAPATDPTLDEAHRSFQHGVELYRAADFDAALVAFKRAYELVPSYKILYNLGQVSYQRNDHPNALRYFRQYLDEGGAAIPPSRQLEVTADVGRLARVVDVPDGDAGRASLPRPEVAPALPAISVDVTTLPAAAPRPPAASVAVAASPPSLRRTSSFPWKSWALTGLLAAGAATTGVIAWRSKQDLDAQLARFPVDDNEVDFYRRQTRGFALATDGLLLGTSLMTALSVYLTFRDSR